MNAITTAMNMRLGLFDSGASSVSENVDVVMAATGFGTAGPEAGVEDEYAAAPRIAACQPKGDE
ncbi:hypothetical protein ACLQ3K_18740 [Tsukamurella sp. DT100]|uniref:hypothetical protein n=1 Tax=Tsukamurella sp. DT100 TaxID=3393415 RepID=UPI003CF7F47B